jgi:hypothetical protein
MGGGSVILKCMILSKTLSQSGQLTGFLAPSQSRCFFNVASSFSRTTETKKRNSNESCSFPRQKIHWVFKQVAGSGWGFGGATSSD